MLFVIRISEITNNTIIHIIIIINTKTKEPKECFLLEQMNMDITVFVCVAKKFNFSLYVYIMGY